jgi:GT2 family glycosyltransferase
MIGLTVTWNRLELTKQMMASVAKDGGFERHIVIDNGSTDGTVEWLKENTDVIITPLPKNKGIAYAFMQALPQIRSNELVCIMDNDMVFMQDNTIQQLESLYHELGGDWVVAPYDVSMPDNYIPKKLGEVWLLGGRLVTKRTHVSGCRVVNHKFANNLFKVRKDIERCASWRRMGYNAGYAEWLQVEHIGLGKTNGTEYLF